MKNTFYAFFVLFFLCSEANNLYATDRYVALSGRDFSLIGTPNDCTNLSTYGPCRTIQHAIGQSKFHDDIKVQTGYYRENISISHAAMETSTIHLDILGGWNIDFTKQFWNPNLTIIDGNLQGSIFNIDSAGYLQVWIQNFTLKGGKEERGGAVYIRSQGSQYAILSELWLLDNIIKENSARYDGGAVYAINYFSNSSLVLHVRGNVIQDNDCNAFSISGPYSDGGAISTRCYDGLLKLDLNENEITENVASRSGGAVYIHSENSSAETRAGFDSNTITGNSVSRWGSAIFLSSKDDGKIHAVFENNMINDNVATNSGNYVSGAVMARIEEGGMITSSFINNTVADNSGGKYFYGLSTFSTGAARGTIVMDVINSILWGNQGGGDLLVSNADITINLSYSDINTWISGGNLNDRGGNINTDPFFMNPSGGDYRLSLGSPAVDSGVCGVIHPISGRRIAPLEDFEGDPRPDPGTLNCEKWVLDPFGKIVCFKGLYYGCDIGADEVLQKATAAMPWIPLLLLD